MGAQDNLINAVKNRDINGSVEITKKLLSEGVSSSRSSKPEKKASKKHPQR